MADDGFVRWEYRVISVDAEDGTINIKDKGEVPFREFIATLGEKGWELVAVAPYNCVADEEYVQHDLFRHMLYFKRTLSD